MCASTNPEEIIRIEKTLEAVLISNPPLMDEYKKEIETLEHDANFLNFWDRIHDVEPWNSINLMEFMDLADSLEEHKTSRSKFMQAVHCGVGLDWIETHLQEVINVWEELKAHHNEKLTFSGFCKGICALQKKHY